jgi:hypothetical protein
MGVADSNNYAAVSTPAACIANEYIRFALHTAAAAER